MSTSVRSQKIKQSKEQETRDKALTVVVVTIHVVILTIHVVIMTTHAVVMAIHGLACVRA
jgi:hypothetical protein